MIIKGVILFEGCTYSNKYGIIKVIMLYLGTNFYENGFHDF